MHTATSPPPLERFSADTFRQWLAGMVSADAPTTTTDRDDMKAAAVAFLAACPKVYGLKKRMELWEKIGNALAAALETCEGDLLRWGNDVLAQIDAAPGRVATCERLSAALAVFDAKPEHWRVACLRLIRDLRFTLPILARDQWRAYVESGKEQEVQDDGNERLSARARAANREQNYADVDEVR